VESSSLAPLAGGRLSRNVVWNLLGLGAPVLVAVVTAPLLIHGLGPDRFGVLALVWAAVGYLGVFDLGLGRALTQLVAKSLGSHADQAIPQLVWTALILMLLLGLAGGLLVASLSPWIVNSVLRVPGPLRHDTLLAAYVVAASVPVVVVSSGLRGVLEARQRFDLVNVVRLPLGIFMFVGPLLALPLSHSLFVIVLVLLAGRAMAALAYYLMCRRLIPQLGQMPRLERAAVGPLVRFGSWMTVSNVVAPLMVTLDRFLIASIVSIAAVTYYATPYEVVTKFWLIPIAATGVLFPAFASTLSSEARRTDLFTRAVKYIAFALFPLTLIIVVFSHEGLMIWLGPEFARQSTQVLQLLMVGVLVNSLAQIPFALIQGVGRPDLTAKLHLAELPVYLLMLVFLVRRNAITGAAVAWLVRVSVDGFLLFVITQRLRLVRPATIARMLGAIGLLLLALLLAAALHNAVLKSAYLAVTLVGWGAVSWFVLLSPEERGSSRNPLRLLGRLLT
jgi:O-antigen/teichoic acid export membrane protein